ncbi:hypothetical protein A2U01_0027898, partial [Trifolium medium]|nr:hypothetical protein [Trifolium medium]
WIGVNSVMHNECITHFDVFTKIAQRSNGTEAGLRTICCSDYGTGQITFVELVESKVKKLQLRYFSMDDKSSYLPRNCQVNGDIIITVLKNLGSLRVLWVASLKFVSVWLWTEGLIVNFVSGSSLFRGLLVARAEIPSY